VVVQKLSTGQICFILGTVVIHWIRLSTGQLLIQWTATQWIKLVVQKQRQWLASYPLNKILSSGQSSSMILCTSCLKAIQTKNFKKGLLSSATLLVIFHSVQFICWDLQMIYVQSFCYFSSIYLLGSVNDLWPIILLFLCWSWEFMSP
jgi:hypothetical protein